VETIETDSDTNRSNKPIILNNQKDPFVERLLDRRLEPFADAEEPPSVEAAVIEETRTRRRISSLEFVVGPGNVD